MAADAERLFVLVGQFAMSYRPRRVAFGRRLVQEVLAGAERNGAVEVTVPTRRARDFYLRLGFEETAVYLKRRIISTEGTPRRFLRSFFNWTRFNWTGRLHSNSARARNAAAWYGLWRTVGNIVCCYFEEPMQNAG